VIRSAIITSFVLSLALMSGCDKPPEGSSTPPEDGSTADTGKGGKDKKKKGDEGDTGGGGGPEEEDPTKKVCPAETADYPSPYFADSVLLRLPKNVTEENFVEFTPTFARISAPIESVSCIEGMPGGMISYMAMTYFEDDPAKDLATLRDETLEVMGYVGATLSNEKRDDKLRFYQAVLDAPGTEAKPDPGRALLQMSAAHGMMYVIVYESHPDAWNALKETFYASAAKMSFPKP
jgi:hypothetical protein